MSYEDVDLRKLAENRANRDTWIDAHIASQIWAKYQAQKGMDEREAYHQAYSWLNSIQGTWIAPEENPKTKWLVGAGGSL